MLESGGMVLALANVDVDVSVNEPDVATLFTSTGSEPEDGVSQRAS